MQYFFNIDFPFNIFVHIFLSLYFQPVVSERSFVLQEVKTAAANRSKQLSFKTFFIPLLYVYFKNDLFIYCVNVCMDEWVNKSIESLTHSSIG